MQDEIVSEIVSEMMQIMKSINVIIDNYRRNKSAFEQEDYYADSTIGENRTYCK